MKPEGSLIYKLGEVCRSGCPQMIRWIFWLAYDEWPTSKPGSNIQELSEYGIILETTTIEKWDPKVSEVLLDKKIFWRSDSFGNWGRLGNWGLRGRRCTHLRRIFVDRNPAPFAAVTPRSLEYCPDVTCIPPYLNAETKDIFHNISTMFIWSLMESHIYIWPEESQTDFSTKRL